VRDTAAAFLSVCPSVTCWATEPIIKQWWGLDKNLNCDAKWCKWSRWNLRFSTNILKRYKNGTQHQEVVYANYTNVSFSMTSNYPWPPKALHFVNFGTYFLHLERLKQWTSNLVHMLSTASVSLTMTNYPKMGRDPRPWSHDPFYFYKQVAVTRMILKVISSTGNLFKCNYSYSSTALKQSHWGAVLEND